MPTALDNAEWWNLYRRIAGDRGLHRCNDKLKQYEKAHMKRELTVSAEMEDDL